MRLETFDINVNPENIVRNMRYTGNNSMLVMQREYAQKMYRTSRASAEAVLYRPEMLPPHKVVTDHMRAKAQQILNVYNDFEFENS